MLSLKNRKTPVQNKKDDETWESIALHYFLVSVFVFCGYGLYFWILFQFCGLILYFFGCVPCWGCLFPFGDLCFCFLVPRENPLISQEFPRTIQDRNDCISYWSWKLSEISQNRKIFMGREYKNHQKFRTKKIKILIKPGIKYERSENEIKYWDVTGDVTHSPGAKPILDSPQ